MSEFAYQRLSGIVAELKELVPRFETSIEPNFRSWRGLMPRHG